MKSLFLFLFLILTYLNAQEKTTINAVLGQHKPPFMFGKDTNKGIEADLLSEIFQNMGYKLNMIQKEKSYMQVILNEKNKYDLVATITPKNKKLFYSDVFTTYENYVITRAEDHLSINSIDDLKTIRFIAWNGAYNDLNGEFYKLFNPIDGTAKHSYNDNMSQLDDIKMFFSKKVDAIIIDKTIFNWYKIHLGNNEQYTFHDIFKTKKTYPVTFRSEKLRDEFNVELQKLKDSGRYDEIIEFYENQDVEELLNFTNLLANISSKLIYDNDINDLKVILKKFFVHPGIVAIVVKDNNNKTLIDIHKNGIKYKKLPKTRAKIELKDQEDKLELGKVYVYYKKDYKSSIGALIPFINKFISNKYFNYIKQVYKDLRIIDNKKIILTKEEQKYLAKKKTITVHNESVWAPYNFNENSIPKGFVIDYMDLLAKKLNINIKYISGYSWKEYIELIKTEQLDVISNIAKTKERESFINFAKPFLKSKKAIFSNTINVKKLSDLSGKTVAVPDQFYIHLYLKKHYPNIKLKAYRNIKECIYAVINKEADALIENYAVINYLIKKDGLNMKYVTINNDQELTTDLSIGVRKSQKILRDILVKAQNSISKFEIEEIEDKWFRLQNQKIEQFTVEQKKYIHNKKTINVCTNPNWAPLEFRDDTPKGITIDILNIIAKKTNLKIQYIKTDSWAQSQEYLKCKKCDILPSVIKTKIREKYAAFTDPYITYDLAIVTKNDKPLVSNISDIVDKKMSRKEASGISMLLKNKYPNIQIKNTKDMLEAFKDIQNGTSYFTITTLPVLAYNSKKYDLNDLQVAGYTNLKYDLRIAVRDDDKKLLSVLNRAISLISKDTIQVINNKWTTQEVIKKTDYSLAFIIFTISFVIISIIILLYLKQSKLKKHIEVLNQSLETKVQEEISKNRQKEKLMLQQSRLAQMGEIISMIAHQWRQPLNTLSMLNQSIIIRYERKKLDEKFVKYFKENSKNQIKNMSDTIDDFRNFFKPEKEKSEFCINKVIENTIDMVNPIFIKEEIDLIVDVNEELYSIGFPNELGQAILNIINNAKDALEEKDIEDKFIKISLIKIDDKIQLTINDNAGGIPSDIINNIFDPYFSTKTQKDGTGLGLYMSKLIIEDHCGGKLEVKNNKYGALFIISFKNLNSSS